MGERFSILILLVLGSISFFIAEKNSVKKLSCEEITFRLIELRSEVFTPTGEYDKNIIVCLTDYCVGESKVLEYFDLLQKLKNNKCPTKVE